MKVRITPQVKTLCHQLNFRAKKRLGQHFLIDEDVLESILSAAELSQQDTVIEVGAGLGVLTTGLAERAGKVIAVELDSKLVSILGKRLTHFPNVKIVQGDILKITPEQLVKSSANASDLAQSYKVVANLPYYITSPVLRLFLQASLKPSLMVLMVQREVGKAIAATPGEMSFLSISTQFYAKPSIVINVPSRSFYPPPKVDSLVLRLDVYSKPPIEVSNVASFFDIVSRGFSSPRKQLRNSLAQALEMPPGQVVSLLEKAGIEAKRRAETLSLEEWNRVWEVFVLLRK